MKNNSQQQVLDYLSRNPMATETQIQIDVWNYFRNYSTETIGWGLDC
jgi:hypothetical protein